MPRHVEKPKVSDDRMARIDHRICHRCGRKIDPTCVVSVVDEEEMQRFRERARQCLGDMASLPSPGIPDILQIAQIAHSIQKTRRNILNFLEECVRQEVEIIQLLDMSRLYYARDGATLIEDIGQAITTFDDAIRPDAMEAIQLCVRVHCSKVLTLRTELTMYKILSPLPPVSHSFLLFAMSSPASILPPNARKLETLSDIRTRL
ncbi:hypothetical protein FA95DRAFT_598256 [Auriscalpium vulgare]|uniref:Uncharacterized protein n=1 Tax=Auriscalpium vulgare TaxID=40419 RepID=A0ACB8S397_9AGAM|nr:hypothetical protein FA95DRAFT_598256 [Auriscalpium vulgare]